MLLKPNKWAFGLSFVALSYSFFLNGLSVFFLVLSFYVPFFITPTSICLPLYVVYVFKDIFCVLVMKIVSSHFVEN